MPPSLFEVQITTECLARAHNFHNMHKAPSSGLGAGAPQKGSVLIGGGGSELNWFQWERGWAGEGDGFSKGEGGWLYKNRQTYK